MTTLQFTLSGPPFNQNPFTNRIIRFQAIQPFIGSYQWVTSDVTGTCYFSNAPASTYTGSILAPPSSVPFGFTVTATNLGTFNVSSIISIPANGLQTVPTGQAAWSILAADQRYAFNTNASGAAPLSAVQTTNLVVNSTNGQSPIVFSNQNTYINTNQLPGLTNLFATSNSLYSTSNALQSQIGSSGISATTGTNIAQAVLTLTNANNTTIVTTNPATVLYTNNLPGLTNGFVDSSITNRSATTNSPYLVQINNGVATNTTLINVTNNKIAADVSSDGAGNFTVGREILGNNWQLNTNNLPGNVLDSSFSIKQMTYGATYTFQTNGHAIIPVLEAPVFINSATSSGIIYSNASGSVNTYLSTGSPLDEILFQFAPYNTAVAIGTNFVIAPYLSGNGGGGTASGAVSNTWTTNLTGTAGAQVTNMVDTEFVGNLSNGVAGVVTNFGNTNFVFNYNGGVTNLFGTNGSLASFTNYGVGRMPIITQSTNLVRFFISGTSSLTNALYVWLPSLGTNINVFTNFVNSGWITNNGSGFQVFNSAGTQLFHNSVIPGSWTVDGGTGNAIADYGAYSWIDGQYVSGSLLINGVPVATLITNISQIAAGGSTNAIPLLGGNGTNTTLVFNSVNWGTNNSVSGSSLVNILSGQGNTILSSGPGASILSGWSNLMSIVSGQSVIDGGIGNTLIGGKNDVIGGGQSNTITHAVGNSGSGANVIAGGFINSIVPSSGANATPQYSSILGGSYNSISNGIAGGVTTMESSTILGGDSNRIAGHFGVVGGFAQTASNSFVFMFGDRPTGSVSNSSAIFTLTNGVGINTNNTVGNALSVGGNVFVSGGLTVNGNLVNGTVSATNVIATNLAISANTNFYQSTNIINVYQAGTGIVTNSTYVWSQAFSIYTNTATGCYITNNGTQWLIQTNLVTLYNSANLVTNQWTAASGSGTASSCYGYYHLRNGEVEVGSLSVSTNNGTSFNETLINPTFTGNSVVQLGQWVNITNPSDNSLILTNIISAATNARALSNGATIFQGPITNFGTYYGNGAGLTNVGIANVLKLGALGGANDDTTALQTILNAGGLIYFPPTNYTTGALFVTNNTEIFSSGAVLQFKSAITSNSVFRIGTGVTNVLIHGFAFDGGFYSTNDSVNRSASGVTNRMGINIWLNSIGSYIYDNVFRGFDKGVAVFSTTGNFGIFQNGKFSLGPNEYYSNYWGFYANSTNANNAVEYFRISGQSIHDNTIGIYINAGNIRITDNDVEDNYIGLLEDGSSGVNPGHSVVSLNAFNHNGGAQGSGSGTALFIANLAATKGLDVFGNTFIGDAGGILLSNTIGNDIHGNTFPNVVVNGANGVSGSTKGPNFIHDNVYSGTWGSQGGNGMAIIDWQAFGASVAAWDQTTNTQHWGNHSTTVIGDMDPYVISPFMTNTLDGSGFLVTPFPNGSGIITAARNMAPYVSSNSAGLHTIVLNGQWTNDLFSRGNIVIQLTVPNNATNSVVYTNTTTGDCFSNLVFNISGVTQPATVTFENVSAGDKGSISNYIGANGNASTLFKATWKLGL